MSQSGNDCSRPARPLKRKASQLEPDHDLHDPPLKQRPQSCVAHQSIASWIQELPKPERPKRLRRFSDSFFVCKTRRRPNPMSSTRSDGGSHSTTPPQSAPLHRPQYTYPPADIFSQQCYRTIIPKADHAPIDHIDPSTLFPISDIPVQCNIPQTPVSCQSVKSSGSDYKAANGSVTSASYRDDLESHGVFVKTKGQLVPNSVHTWARTILDKRPTLPSLQQDEIRNTQILLGRLASENETDTRESLAETFLFPGILGMDPRVKRASDGLWSREPLPHTSGLGLPPISTPKPDRHYGYSRRAFSNQEYGVMSHRRLSPYAHPSTSAYWPFFMIEFQAQSRGGTMWVAQNQNAGNGAHSLNSVRMLLQYSKKCKMTEFQNMLFTCVADADDAALWVHWYEEGDRITFFMAEVDHFHFARDGDMESFRDKVKNIIDHGLNVRLPCIKTALGDIAVEDLEKAEKARLSRPASTPGSVQNKRH